MLNNTIFCTQAFYCVVLKPRNFRPCKIICLSLSAYDKLQLINAAPQVYSVLVSCAGDLIQKQSANENFFEIQLAGKFFFTYLFYISD